MSDVKVIDKTMQQRGVQSIVYHTKTETKMSDISKTPFSRALLKITSTIMISDLSMFGLNVWLSCLRKISIQALAVLRYLEQDGYGT